MNNLNAVFQFCPIVNHQLTTDMQQLQLDMNQDTVQATIDVCLHLTYLRNLTPNKLGPVQIALSVVSGQLATAVPYQIIPNKTYKTTSIIDLETYSSSLYVLHPWENSIIDEMVIFKIHVPIDHVETGNLRVKIALETWNEMSFDNSNASKKLAEVSFNFNSILYIDSFLPCLFEQYGIALEGNIYTHILGCKYANFSNIYRHHLYQAIDHLVICYNKLRQKTAHLNRKQKNQEKLENHDDHENKENSENHGNQKNKEKQENKENSENYQKLEEIVEELPFYIDMKKYQEYEKIKNFIEKRIFQEQTMKQHREILRKFVQKFIPEMTQKLLIVWKEFLKLRNVSLVDQSKKEFHEKLTIELKKIIQYKVEKPYTTLSQIQSKSNSSEISSPSYSSSISESEYHEVYTMVENEIAHNDLKHCFHDKDNYISLRKLYISNLQLPYPSIKVNLHKSLRIQSQEKLSAGNEPHIVVFVHGLGATSNAFTEFQLALKNLYWKNVIVLNSICNESLVDDELEEMGRKLSNQVTQFILQHNFAESFQLSFIGHSLGGLIIRAALPKLQTFKFNMKTLIMLSSPNLGYFYHNSTLNKAGMWAISKVSNNKIINNLLMNEESLENVDEETGYRNSYLFSLSNNKGMGWFEHVMFCGSSDDYFVSPLSALATTRESIQMKKDLKSQIWEEMRVNIESNLINCNIYRLLVDFGQKSEASIKDQLIGKASHVMYLSSKDFISYILLGYKDLFA